MPSKSLALLLALAIGCAIAPTSQRLPPPAMALRQEPPGPVVLPDAEQRAAFDRVREFVRIGNYEAAHEIVAPWHERYPAPSPYGEGYVWKCLAEALPRSGEASPIGLALLADLLGLPALARAGYAEHIENGRENVWTAKWNLCMYAVRCSIQLHEPDAALAWFERAATLAEEPWHKQVLTKRDAYLALLANPSDPRIRIRFSVEFWEREYPPWSSPFPDAIAAYQALLDDAGQDLDSALRAELYLRIQSLELAVDQRERARFWARRLVRDVPASSAVAALPPDGQEPRPPIFNSGLRSRSEVLWTTADLLEEVAEYESAAGLLFALLAAPPRDGLPEPDCGPIGAHSFAARLSVLYEKAGDLRRALEWQLAARDVYPSHATCGFGEEQRQDEARIADLRLRIDNTP